MIKFCGLYFVLCLLFVYNSLLFCLPIYYYPPFHSFYNISPIYLSSICLLASSSFATGHCPASPARSIAYARYPDRHDPICRHFYRRLSEQSRQYSGILFFFFFFFIYVQDKPNCLMLKISLLNRISPYFTRL